jgi:hypothetical protein
MMTTQQKLWLEKAEALKPTLFRRTVKPRHWVRPERDAQGFQGWRLATLGPPEEFYARYHRRDLDATFDFGEYCVGQVRFEIEVAGTIDSPLRLQIKLGETPAEVGEDFNQYQGTLSRSWLQEEILNLERPGAVIRLPRRYAFRYLRFHAEYDAGYQFRIKNVVCDAVTSADLAAVSPLPASCPEPLRDLDRISLNTLKNCMQTVFEDGPKRDRRLWLGDFRLQALVNYHSFKNYGLAKRCLYLFAALADEHGRIPACLYERPQPHNGNSHIYDYTALFAPTLLEYAQASGDWDTAAELWPVAVRQLDIVQEDIDETGLFQDRGKWWLFIDWSSGLDRQAAEQGVVIFSLKKACELARALGREPECAVLERRIAHLSRAAMEQLFDAGRQVFVSGKERQVSWASQAWLALAGVLPPDAAAGTLRAVAATPAAVKPVGPYLYHYVVEAMFACGMAAEGRALLLDYWGAMAKLGADNFWEVFDPQDPSLSPYGSHLINSYCHAWSCTPSYFLRSGPAAHGFGARQS